MPIAITCGAQFTNRKMIRRALDVIRYGHSDHKCVRDSSYHVLRHMCLCGKSCPRILTAKGKLV